MKEKVGTISNDGGNGYGNPNFPKKIMYSCGWFLWIMFYFGTFCTGEVDMDPLDMPFPKKMMKQISIFMFIVYILYECGKRLELLQC